ncbi:MAG: protein phosphatase 2C domain-containing protein, partial [candidate division WOR-3 bacterium]
MKIEAVGKTDIGKRDNNEDSFLVDLENLIFLVCDGVGGNKSGEVASSCACSTVKKFWNNININIDYRLNDKLSLLPQDSIKLVNLVRLANHLVYLDSLKSLDKRGMGTTIAGISFNEDGYATLVNVGDSRIYRLKNGNLEQLSRDHTMANELLEDGEISENELKDFWGKHEITRALGAGPTVKIDIHIEPVEKDDTFVICSDGLSGVVPN